MAKNRFDVDLDLDAKDMVESVQNQFNLKVDDDEDEDEVDNLADEGEDIEISQEELDAANEENDDEDDSKKTQPSKKKKDVKDEGDEDTENEGDDSQEDVEDKKTSKKTADNEKPKKHSRYNERIIKLVNEKKDAEARAERLAAEKDAEIERLRRQNFESEKSSISAAKEHLKSRLENLKAAFAVAGEENDFAKQVEINTEASKIGAQMAQIEDLEGKYKEYRPEPRKNTYAGTFDEDKANKLAQDWEFENPRMLSDANYKNTSITLGRQLMARGFKPDSEEFYDELSSRMAKAYGYEYKSTLDKTKVKDEYDFGDDESNEDEVEQKAEKKKKPAPKQAVSGASRTPSPTGSSAGGLTVRLKPEEQAQAKRMGQTNKEFALNKLRLEKATDEKGRVSVSLFGDDE